MTWIDAGRPAVLVGGSALCDLRVPTGAKHHVLVIKGPGGFEVRNLSSWYRMRVNGQVLEQARLQSDDRSVGYA